MYVSICVYIPSFILLLGLHGLQFREACKDPKTHFLPTSCVTFIMGIFTNRFSSLCVFSYYYRVHPNNKLTFHHNPRLLTATPSTESSTFSTNSRQSNGTPTNSMINHEGDESNAGHHDHQNTPPRLRNHALKMKFLADLATEAETMRENNPQNCHSNYSTFKGGLENYTSFKTFYPDQVIKYTH